MVSRLWVRALCGLESFSLSFAFSLCFHSTFLSLEFSMCQVVYWLLIPLIKLKDVVVIKLDLFN